MTFVQSKSRYAVMSRYLPTVTRTIKSFESMAGIVLLSHVTQCTQVDDGILAIQTLPTHSHDRFLNAGTAINTWMLYT